MDYIPQPLSSVTPPIIVPLAAIIPYELGSFEDFPRRYGFAEEGGRLDLNTRTVPEVATVLQSWLYFGLLSEFLGRSVESQELAQKATLPDGSIIDRVSTNQLSDLFQKSVLDLKGRKGELWSLLEFANDQSRLVDTQLPSVSPVSEIMLSIKILLLTLSDFAFPNPEKYHPNLDVRPLDILSINVISPATKLLVDRMESAGWCPQQVIQLCTQYNYAVVYYLSQLHRRYRKGLSHSDCSGSQCVANHIDMKSYPVQHACAPCSCTSISTEEDIEVFHDSAEEPLVSPLCRRCSCCDIKVDAEKLRQIVSEGGVPLISIQQTDNGKITLGVEKFKNSSRYVAISHVWSDGMGNPDDNALPQCILARMAAHFETLPFSPCEHPSSWLTGLVAYTKHIVQLAGFRIEDNSPQLFWMDTLCIPVGDDHVHLRKMAINQMALIYAAASQVLILDSELQRVRIGGSQEAEVLGHILTCAWKTRCWTLQEGAIAQARRYQMLDGVMDLETKRPSRRSLLFGRMTVRIVFLHLFPSFLQSFRQRMIKSWKSSRKNMNIYRSRELENFDGFVQQKLTSNLRVGCRERLQGFWDWPARNAIGQANPKALYVQFVAVWNALGCRTTTQREDLCLILASLLDLNSYVLIGMDSYDEKMKILLWTVGRLPLSLLYNTGKRVQADQDHSNRWVPGEPSSCFLEQEPSVKLSEDSLVLKSKNLSKTNSVFLIASLANIKNLNDKLILEDANNGSRYIIEFLRQPNDKIDIGLYTSFGMLVEGHLYSDAIPEGLETRGACLLTNWTVFASQEEGSNGETTIRAKYDCPLRVWPYNAETSAIGIAISSRTTPDDNQKILMGMRPTGPWKLKIEADFHNTGSSLYRRPIKPYGYPYQSYGSQITLYLLFVAYFHLFPTVLQLPILIRAWANLHWLVKTRYLLWLIAYIPPLLYYVDFIHIPLLVWLTVENIMQFIHTTIALFAGLVPVATILPVFLGLPFVQMMLPFFLYPLIAVFYLILVPKAHDAWIATFNKDWSPSASHAWFWTTSRIIYKVLNSLNRLSGNAKGSLGMITTILCIPLNGVRTLRRSISRRWDTRQRVNGESSDAELDLLV